MLHLRPGYMAGMGAPQAVWFYSDMFEELALKWKVLLHRWPLMIFDVDFVQLFSATQGMPGGPPTQTYMQADRRTDSATFP